MAREEVVVVSKIGYVQGQNLELAAEREQQGRPYPEVVKYADGIWHCMHPEFLADQLTRSLDRLGMTTLDACLLHNPEYYLKDAHERSYGTLEKRRAEFYRRLTEAFAHLEGEVKAGRLGRYGVSSNTCAATADDPEGTSLSRMLEAAREGGGDSNHFHVLQLPLNLLEAGGLRARNTGPAGARTVLELAAEAGLAVLVNRPLNAIAEDGMVRLADAAVPEAPELPAQLRAVAERELAFRREIGASLRTAEGSVPPDELFRWSDELSAIETHLRGLEHWEQIEGQRILPRLVEVLQVLDRNLASGPLAEAWHTWRGEYLPELQKLLAACRRLAALRSRESTDRITAAIDGRLAEERRRETLSRKAIWIAASTPGVTSVLVGMRRPEYVDDALKVLDWPPLANAAEVYDAVALTNKG